VQDRKIFLSLAIGTSIAFAIILTDCYRQRQIGEKLAILCRKAPNSESRVEPGGIYFYRINKAFKIKILN
jgi:hypothetical protein